MPNFTIRGKLSYQRCAEVHATARFPEHGKPIVKRGGCYHIQKGRHTHPFTDEVQQAYWLNMYSTRILVYFADGTIQVNPYDSMTTRTALNAFAPMSFYTNSHSSFQTHFRWHNRKAVWEGPNYPVAWPLNIDPEGWVYGLKDMKRRVKPECRKERREIIRRFREGATARLLLGEFDRLLLTETGMGWRGYLPRTGERRERLFDLFSACADHEEIVDVCQELSNLDVWHVSRCATHAETVKKILGVLLAQKLDDCRGSPWHEDVIIEYPPVRAVG